jgi:hypothetical protein
MLSFVKPWLHLFTRHVLMDTVPAEPDDAARCSVHAATVSADDEPTFADGSAVADDVRAPVPITAPAAAGVGGARAPGHGVRRHDQRVQHPPRRGQHGRRWWQQQLDERWHVLRFRPQRQRCQGGLDLGRHPRWQLQRSERGRRVPEGRHRGGRQLEGSDTTVSSVFTGDGTSRSSIW